MAAVNHLTIPKLRSILKYHHISQFGTKDQLVIRVHLLRHNHSDAATARKEGQLTDLIHLIYEVIRKQKELKIINHVYRTHTYSSKQSRDGNSVPIPDHIGTVDDLSGLFNPLLSFIKDQRAERKRNDEQSVYHHYNPSKTIVSNDDATKERIAQVGSKVKVKWTAEEVKGSGWKAGWYTAIVHRYDEDLDILTITYASEPNIPYEEELGELLAQEKIQLVWSLLSYCSVQTQHIIIAVMAKMYINV